MGQEVGSEGGRKGERMEGGRKGRIHESKNLTTGLVVLLDFDIHRTRRTRMLYMCVRSSCYGWLVLTLTETGKVSVRKGQEDLDSGGKGDTGAM